MLVSKDVCWWRGLSSCRWRPGLAQSVPTANLEWTYSGNGRKILSSFWTRLTNLPGKRQRLKTWMKGRLLPSQRSEVVSPKWQGASRCWGGFYHGHLCGNMSYQSCCYRPSSPCINAVQISAGSYLWVMGRWSMSGGAASLLDCCGEESWAASWRSVSLSLNKFHRPLMRECRRWLASAIMATSLFRVVFSAEVAAQNSSKSAKQHL